MCNTLKINYSIIIPHKNIPNLLQICLDSIPRREDIQIIVVDDNSDPDIVDFEQFPCLNDPSVEITFSKEGRGAGFARNTGLLKAAGNWILFADSDDYFNNGFIDILDKYKDSDYDLIYFGKEPPGKAIYNDRLIYNSWVPWNKMTKKSVITDNCIFFDESIAANDKMFSIKSGFYAKNVYFDKNNIYTFVKRRNSISSNKSLEANFARFIVYIRINSFLDDISKQSFKINIVKPLLNLLNIKNMTYFHSALRLIKDNNYCLFLEIVKYLVITIPKRISIFFGIFAR